MVLPLMDKCMVSHVLLHVGTVFASIHGRNPFIFDKREHHACILKVFRIYPLAVSVIFCSKQVAKWPHPRLHDRQRPLEKVSL